MNTIILLIAVFVSSKCFEVYLQEHEPALFVSQLQPVLMLA